MRKRGNPSALAESLNRKAMPKNNTLVKKQGGSYRVTGFPSGIKEMDTAFNAKKMSQFGQALEEKKRH